MGQAVSIKSSKKPRLDTFIDLRALPPEVAVSILANLNATDLCLAGCVWQEFAENEILWKRLCLAQWQYLPSRTLRSRGNGLTIDSQICKKQRSYRELYLLLDEAMLLLRINPNQGILYLKQNGILGEELYEIAKFLDCTHEQLLPNYQKLLEERDDILVKLVELQDYTNQRLSEALRSFFRKIHPTEDKGYMDRLLGLFSSRYHQCSNNGGLSIEATGVLSYSLLLLSVDLYSPHVKNKMSKREFIRNNRRVLPDVHAELLGDLYDDVYVNGHVAISCPKMGICKSNPYERPYGVLFELKSWSGQFCC